MTEILWTGILSLNQIKVNLVSYCFGLILYVPVNSFSGNSVVECLTRDRRSAGSSLTGVTLLWSLSKTFILAYYWFNPGRPIPI